MKTQLTHIGMKNGVKVYRVEYLDTEKNLSYVKKRKELGERATAELGAPCFG